MSDMGRFLGLLLAVLWLAACSAGRSEVVTDASQEQLGSDQWVPGDAETTDLATDVRSDGEEGDGVVPFSPCLEAGGMCLESSLSANCPSDHDDSDLSCGSATAFCCMPWPCIPEGSSFENAETTDGICCEGLSPIPQCSINPDGQCLCKNCPCYTCVKCGDGTCGPGESTCNCPGDCPPLVLNPCTEAGGVCAEPCPDYWMPVDLGGCNGTNFCCYPESVDCIQEGLPGTGMPGDPECCEGLSPIPEAGLDPETEECLVLPGGIVCTHCGDGVCGMGEAICNCPQDCTPNECELEGGTCSETCSVSQAAVELTGCDQGLLCCLTHESCTQAGGTCLTECGDNFEAIDVPGCEEGDVCCVEAQPCLVAGETGAVVPGAAECCPGLTHTSVSQANPESGECEPLIGGFICIDCGNGTCESFENKCMCPEDCPEETQDCYGTLVPCAQGQYCRIPDGQCHLTGVWGTCTDVPEVCLSVQSPVCGCDGKTYENDCELQIAMMSLDYQGACCIPEGGEFEDWGEGGPTCCSGLTAVDACIVDSTGNCACPNCPCKVCTQCGDGTCGLGENKCNCPDCES